VPPTTTTGPPPPPTTPPPPGVLGTLRFTGSDTIDLALLGGMAVVTGRILYAFGRRRPREEEPEPAPTNGPFFG
jgi:hypothetical protein